MGPLGVIDREPGLGDGPNLVERVEEVGVQDLLAKRPVEALDEGVLIGLARLNVAQSNPLRRAPVHKRLGGELGPVVDPYPSGSTVEPNEIVDHTDHPCTGNRRPDFDRQRFAVAFIDDVEDAKAPAVVQGIGHENRAPTSRSAAPGP